MITPLQTKGLRYGWGAPCFALLAFTLLALCLTGRGMFSGGAVCAGENADTWFHLWAFWKTKNALLGGDSGYMMSHMLFYPGRYFDPISVVDPLLSLMSVPLQLASVPLTTIFNLFVAGGLIFSAMAGYLLIAKLAGSRMAGFLGGLVVGFNPFVYRQVAGGFIEYAWCGVVPLTLWLYQRAKAREGGQVLLMYAASLLLMILVSFYCAAIYAGFILADGLLQVVRLAFGQKHHLHSLLRPLAVSLLVVMPVIAGWAAILSRTDSSVAIARRFPTDKLVSSLNAAHGEANGTVPAPSGVLRIPSPGCPVALQWTAQPYRTLRGSLDAYFLAHWSREEAIAQFRNCGDTNPVRRRFDFVFGLELAAVLGLCVVALAGAPRRLANWRWFALALLFTLMAMGPHLIWNREVMFAISLPYAFCCQWVPGFSLLVIPGRAFLGAALCLAVLSARGLTVLLQCRELGKTLQRRWATGATLVAAVLVSFMAFGYGGVTLPATRIQALPVYAWLARQAGHAALIELPLRGDVAARTYGQCIHARPVFRGFFMEGFPAPAAPGALARALGPGGDAGAGKSELDQGVAWLARQGFGYLVLHASGYERREAYARACTVAGSLLGPSAFADDHTTAWGIPAGANFPWRNPDNP